MPTYGYRCTVCGHEFERFQKITDPALTECENCHGAVKKIMYPVGIAFKGSGFYVNDSRASETKATTKSESKDSSSDTKADAKPETKTDTATTETKSETKPATTDSKPATPATNA